MTNSDSRLSDEEQALRRVVLETPADDTPRLVYADWLEDHGRPNRAEFIRVQVELARLEECWEGDTRAGRHARRDELRRRERELWEGKRRAIEWFSDIFLPPTIDPSVFVLGSRVGLSMAFVRRGFVEAVRLPWATWRDHVDLLSTTHPVTDVTLTTWPEWEWGHSTPPRHLVNLRGRPDDHAFVTTHGIDARYTTADRAETVRTLLRRNWPRVRTWTLPSDRPPGGGTPGGRPEAAS